MVILNKPRGWEFPHETNCVHECNNFWCWWLWTQIYYNPCKCYLDEWKKFNIKNYHIKINQPCLLRPEKNVAFSFHWMDIIINSFIGLFFVVVYSIAMEAMRPKLKYYFKMAVGFEMGGFWMQNKVALINFPPSSGTSLGC